MESARDETDRERAFAETLLERYNRDPQPDLEALNQAYSRAMKEPFILYPEDDDAAVLCAESLILTSSTDGAHIHAAEQVNGEALAAVEAVVAQNPRLVGANHYHIHFLESSVEPERALPSARRLEALMSNTGHLLHMPSHIYIRLRDYRASVAVNLRAVSADRAQTARTGKEPALAAHSR